MMNTMIAYAADLTGGAVGICPTGKPKDITEFINFFTCTLMNAVVPLLVGLAVAAFVYGIVKYFLNPENEEKRKEGKNYLMWGLIALFVMVSIWGLVSIFTVSFTGSQPLLPSFPKTSQ